MELCAQEQCCAQNRSVLQPLVHWCSLLPTLSFLPPFQIFAIKEENNRLRQEKQVLKNKLEELKKKVLWNDPVMVTECVCGHLGLLARAQAWLERLRVNAAGHCVMIGTAPVSRQLLCQGQELWSWLWDSRHCQTLGETLLRFSSCLFEP